MSKDETHLGRSLVALLIGATAIGVAPILVRLSEVGPSATAFLRITFALPVYGIWFLVEKSNPKQSSKSPLGHTTILALALTGFFFAGDLSIWHWSLQFTSVANSTLLTNLAPIFVLIGAKIFLHEKASRSLAFGILIGMTGAALLVIESLQLSSRNLRGDLLAIITALFYAGYIVAMKRSRREVSTPAAMFWSGLVSCPLLFLAGWFAGEDFIPESTSGWGVVLSLAIISHLFGQGLIAYGLAHLPASISAASLLWQPVVAAVLAAIFLNEKLTLTQISGGLIVLLGIYLAQRSLREPKPVA